MSLLRDAYEEYVIFLQGQAKESKMVAFGRLPGQDGPASRSAFAHVLKRVQGNSYFPKDRDVQIWQALCNLTKSLSVILNDCLPDFVSLVQSFVPGRLFNLELVEMSQLMPAKVLEVYTTILQNVFFLQTPISDLASNLARGIVDVEETRSPQSGRQTSGVPELSLELGATPDMSKVPSLGAAFLFAHPITMAHFMALLHEDLDTVVENMREMQNDEASFSDVRWVLDKIKWRGVDALCSATIKECRGFSKYEDWIFEHIADREAKTQEHTLWMESFGDFVSYVLKCLGSVLPVHDESLPTFAVEQLKMLVSESLFAALDCMEWLAIEWTPDANGHTDSRGYIERLEANRIRSVLSEPLTRNMSASLFNTAHVKHRPVDVTRRELRLLAVLSNLGYLETRTVPALINLVYETLEVSVDQPSMINLTEAAKYLRVGLSDAYVKSKSAKLADVIRTGVLFSGIDWPHMTRPQEVSSYAYDTLVSLALIHAEVNDVAHQLVRPILEELVQDVGQVQLESFRKIDQFCFAGNLQAKLETEFVEKALKSYQNASSEQLFKLVYQTIEEATVMSEAPIEDGPEMIASVREYLMDTREATAALTRCLQDE